MTRATKVLTLAGIAAALFVVLLAFTPAPASPSGPDSDPYRVELVSNDVYKVQKALNSNAAQGWWFVSGIERADGKVLLIFRSAQ